MLRGWPGWLGLAGPIRPLLSHGQPSFRLVKLPNQPAAFLGAQRATVLAALLQTLQLGTRCRHGDVLCVGVVGLVVLLQQKSAPPRVHLLRRKNLMGPI